RAKKVFSPISIRAFWASRLFQHNRPVAAPRDRQKSAKSVKKRFAKIEVSASTLNLKFIGTSADVDFA
ncbi:MAG: hypothetical protein ACK418_15105, partial [Pseudomonas sp.]|uniref:hypothetical protein n=1 Tax=Pseudomonas sp. TaxID=306 RepID=UPI003919A56E